jgi:DNA-binding NtrC family response regulator
MSDGKLRVLAIDDEVGINQALKKAVEALGHEARATANIDEFKSALETWDPGLVIIDVNMPDCDGVELLHHLAERDARRRYTCRAGSTATRSMR